MTDAAELDLAAQARWLREVRGAADRQGVPVVINARVDVHLRQVGPPEGRLDDALRRGSAYLAAGADRVFPIIVSDEPTIRALVTDVGGPINCISGPDPLQLERLAELGVARISLGGRDASPRHGRVGGGAGAYRRDAGPRLTADVLARATAGPGEVATA